MFLGPLEGQDIAGLNTPYYVSQSLFPVLSDAKEPPAFLKEMIDRNELGIEAEKDSIHTKEMKRKKNFVPETIIS